MVTTESNQDRKREYILVRNGQQFYYARASRTDPDMYTVMANVGEQEGRMIIEKANASSEWDVQSKKPQGTSNEPL